MVGRTGTKWVKAAVCAAALAAPLAVSGCASQAGANGATGTTGAQAGPASSANSGASSASSTASVPSATPSSAGSTTAAPAPATSTAAPASSAPSTARPALNATGGTGLVVSDGSSRVLINGKTVDFGTAVHDPAFTPDGSKVAFIDGGGNLVMANPDGSGKVRIAKNPGGQKWSHPTFQITPGDQYRPPRGNIFFASSADGGTLWSVPALPEEGKPVRLSLSHGAGRDVTELPQNGNQWPSESGKYGTAVYEHDNGSSSDVYIRDDYLRQQGGMEIKDAAQPSFALVGGSATTSGATDVVFVREVNGHRHVFFFSNVPTSTGMQVSAPRDLTPNAASDCSMPVLSPDGKTVAYSTSAGVFTVAVKGSSTAKQVTDVPGFPAFRGGF